MGVTLIFTLRVDLGADEDIGAVPALYRDSAIRFTIDFEAPGGGYGLFAHFAETGAVAPTLVFAGQFLILRRQRQSSEECK